MKQLVLALMLGVSALAGIARAQTTTGGSIRGYVTDEQKAILQGVTITGSSHDAPVTYTAVTDDSGFFRLLDLPPGTYTLSAEHDGFTTHRRDGLVVRAGLNLSTDIVMRVGTISESVDVSSTTPLLESQSSTQAVNVSGRLQRSMPLGLTKGWDAFMLMMPGVTVSSEGETAQLAANVRAANFDSTVVQLDGARIDSAFQGGTWNLHMGSDTIQDTQVKLAGVDAAVPLGVGGVISVASRSGTNQPTGAVSYSAQPKRWAGQNVPDGTSSTVAQQLLDTSGGAPIVRNHVWAFGSYRRQYLKNGLVRTERDLRNLRALQPGFEPFDNESHGNFTFVKGTAQLAPGQQISGFHQYDSYPNDNLNALSGSRFQHRVTGGPAASGRWSSSWGPSLTTTVVGSFTRKVFDSVVLEPSKPGRTIYDSVFKSGGVLVGSTTDALLDSRGFQGAHVPYDKFTLAADATYWRTRRLGSHQVRTGFYLETHHNRSIQDFYNDGFVLQEEVLRDPSNPGAGSIPFRKQIYDQGGPFENLRTRGSDVGVYVQDDYRPSSRLTLNLGVRVDWIHHRDDLFASNVQNSTEIGPRVGLNYRLTQDGRNVVTASWTRVHDQLFRTEATVGSTALGVRNLYDVDLDGTFETTIVTPPATRVTPDTIIDPDRHQPFVDEWNIVYQRQLPGDLRVDVGFNRRDFKDVLTSVESNGIYENGVFKGYRNESLNAMTLRTNNTWNRPVYTDVTVTISRQSARVNLLSSYTRQFRHLEGTWQPNDPASFIQPGAFANDKGIGITHGGNVDSYSTSATFSRIQWQDHVLRASASVVAPWRMLLATTYSFQSGPWSGPIVTRLPAGDPKFGPSTITLSNGRVVSNPLSTPIRFAFATRGEGQFHLDGVHVWNVRVGRDLALGHVRLQPSLDVFNVVNADGFYFLQSGANDLTSPLYRQGNGRQWPRSVQIGIRAVF
jgi:Carboxypeptidase regulatory-like domain